MPKRKRSNSRPFNSIGARSAKARRFTRRTPRKFASSIKPTRKHKGSSRRRRVRRRVGRGRGVRRVGGLYQSTRPNAFKRKLTLASGTQYLVTRSVQNEFQVLPSTIYLGAYTEPMAQYVYPREASAATTEVEPMYYPYSIADVYYLITSCIPSSMTVNQNAILYKAHMMTKCHSVYTIRNQTNYPTRFEVLKFYTKRDIANVSSAAVGTSQGYINPLNIAGAYLNRLADMDSTDTDDATNKALHTNRIKFEQLPPISVYFTCRKKIITLSPGELRTYHINQRKSWSFFDLLGTTDVGSNPYPRQTFWKGTKWLMFKMLSDSADYTGATGETGDIINNKSTCTTPACLLAYQSSYSVLVPSILQETIKKTMPTLGLSTVVAAGTIANMADSDEKEVLQIVVD